MTDRYSTLDHPVLEFAFECRLQFTRVHAIPNVHNGGFRSAVLVDSGHFEGPRLRGKAVPNSGGDWPRMWASGLIEFEAHYMLEADDGTPIYIHNRGVAFSPPEVLARIEAGEAAAAEDTYCRITPRFEAPAGPHEWLCRTIFVPFDPRNTRAIGPCGDVPMASRSPSSQSGASNA